MFHLGGKKKCSAQFTVKQNESRKSGYFSLAFLSAVSDSVHQQKPLWALDEVPVWIIPCATASAGTCYLYRLQMCFLSEQSSALPFLMETRARS